MTVFATGTEPLHKRNSAHFWMMREKQTLTS